MGCTMDLLSKLNIVEKNITILIARIVHGFNLNDLNTEYHKVFLYNEQAHWLSCKGSVTSQNRIAFNYRYIDRGDLDGFCIYHIFDNGTFVDLPAVCPLPQRYTYSSSKPSANGFK